MPKKPRIEESSSFDPTLSRGVIAIVLLIVAGIISLSFFDKAGALGEMLNNYVLSFLFGSMRYGIPAIILVYIWYVVQDNPEPHRPTRTAGTILFFLATSGLFHLQFETSKMFTEALNGHGGGIFGMLAWPIKTYTSQIASILILVGLSLISLLFLFREALPIIVTRIRLSRARMTDFRESLKAPLPPLPANKKQKSFVFEETPEEKEETEQKNRRLFFSKEVGAKFFGRNKKQNDEETEDEETDEEDDTKEMEESEPEVSPKEKTPVMVSSESKGESINMPPMWQRQVVVKELPPVNLLVSRKEKPTSGDIKSNMQMIGDTLKEFHIGVEMGEVRVGPTVTQYSLKPDKGMKLSRITALSNDLALALAAHPIRIEAPIPGKSLVGIEVPNRKAAMVSFRELLEAPEFEARPHNMMIGLGKDVGGKVWFADLPRMPHLLIAGTTGSGKTVCMNTIILSLLYQNTAETLRFIMVDPKRVELTLYNGIPHLLTPVITNTQKTVNALKWAIGEMERRFEVLSQAHNRDITSYNEQNPTLRMPHIVFVIDELADLMATAAGEVEAGIIRLAQMARAVGIHLIVATQRPSVDVITGLMKANIPARIAFSVASVIDSRTILDGPGAEKLLGRGDMLMQTADLSKPIRIQGAYISEDEMKKVVEYLKSGETPVYDESIVEKPGAGSTSNMFGGVPDGRDELFEEAKSAILEAGKASASLLQRRLKVGYARAARLLDELQDAGIIGPGDGAKPREILVTETEIETSMHAGGEFTAFAPPRPAPVLKVENLDEEELVEDDSDEETDEIIDENEENEEETPEKKYT
jgi:S-DNA-T family DNA segregation ATPase FtsK/SpoIIIE